MEHSGKQNPKIGFKSPPEHQFPSIDGSFDSHCHNQARLAFLSGSYRRKSSGRGGSNLPGSLLTGRAAIVSDRKVGGLYGERVSDALAREGFKVSTHLVDPGETSKSFEMASSVVRRFCPPWSGPAKLRRSLGGGVVGDLAGFAAAIYYRGVPVVQIPDDDYGPSRQFGRRENWNQSERRKKSGGSISSTGRGSRGYRDFGDSRAARVERRLCRSDQVWRHSRKGASGRVAGWRIGNFRIWFGDASRSKLRLSRRTKGKLPEAAPC